MGFWQLADNQMKFNLLLLLHKITLGKVLGNQAWGDQSIIDMQPYNQSIFVTLTFPIKVLAAATPSLAAGSRKLRAILCERKRNIYSTIKIKLITY